MTNEKTTESAASALSAGFEADADDLSMFASQIREAMKGEGDLPHPWAFDDWLVIYRDHFDRSRKVSNVEFSGTPAALSPEAPLERHVSRQDNFISAEMLKTALMTPEQQALVEQMICPKCGVMTLLRKHDGGGMLFNQCSQCLTVWVLTANG